MTQNTCIVLTNYSINLAHALRWLGLGLLAVLVCADAVRGCALLKASHDLDPATSVCCRGSARYMNMGLWAAQMQTKTCCLDMDKKVLIGPFFFENIY